MLFLLKLIFVLFEVILIVIAVMVGCLLLNLYISILLIRGTENVSSFFISYLRTNSVDFSNLSAKISTTESKLFIRLFIQFRLGCWIAFLLFFLAVSDLWRILHLSTDAGISGKLANWTFLHHRLQLLYLDLHLFALRNLQNRRPREDCTPRHRK